ncbi:MAG: HEPN domain-containing protein [Candidatus Solibacter sp.]|nr:HEPN domain-containing protein [Candidatus Solibacter sp.]
MTSEESPRDEANRWLAQARKDLNAARVLASPEPSRSVFHSQQTAEKAAKAYLAFHEVQFRKTHDLIELGRQCAALNAALAPFLMEAADLTDYATVFRYLDAPREPDEKEAAGALEIARRLFEEISTLLTPGPG